MSSCGAAVGGYNVGGYDGRVSGAHTKGVQERACTNHLLAPSFPPLPGADESEEEGFDPERDASCAEESESEGEGALEAEAPDDTAVAAVGAVRLALQQGSAGAHVPPPVGPGAPPGVAPTTKPSAHPGMGLPPRAPRAPAPPGSEGHREGALTTSRPGSKPPADCTCSTCGTRDAKRWVRVSADQTGVPAGETAPEGGGDSEAQAPRDGGWECPVCARYRRDHKGQPRPSRLWLKTGAGRGAGGKPAPPLPAKPKPGGGLVGHFMEGPEGVWHDDRG